MNLLAIDTSTTSTVLGLLLGKKIVDHTVVDAKKHSREILPAIATLMAKSDLAYETLMPSFLVRDLVRSLVCV